MDNGKIKIENENSPKVNEFGNLVIQKKENELPGNELARAKEKDNIKGIIFQGALTVFLMLILVFLLSAGYFGGRAATYTFLQTDWSGGQSTQYPAHPGDQSGWTKYESKTGNVNTTTAGQISISTANGSFTQTTAADFSGNNPPSTLTVTGSGAAGSVKLTAQNQNGSFMQTDDSTNESGFNASGNIKTNTQITGSGASASLILTSSLTAFSQGPKSLDASTGAVNISNTTCGNGGGGNWSNATVGNLSSSDNVYASHYGPYPGGSKCLIATGFNFSLPLDATITGIGLSIERKKQGSINIVDTHIRIIKNGIFSPENKANTTLNWPTSDTIVSYGGLGQLWGFTDLTPSDINSASFGAVIGVSTGGDEFASAAYIDHITLTVYYDKPLYSTTGDFTSSAKIQDSLNGATLNNLTWNGVEPSGTDLKFQIGTYTDTNCSQNFSGFKGPTGASDYYNPAPGVPVTITAANHPNAKCIKYKAFFSSSADQLATPRLDDITISYTYQLYPSGTAAMISSGFSPGYSFNVNGANFSFSGNVPSGTTLRFQLQSFSDAACTVSKTGGNYVGPNGASNTYYPQNGTQTLTTIHDGARCLKYKAEFASDATRLLTPQLDDVSFFFFFFPPGENLVGNAYNTGTGNNAILSRLIWNETGISAGSTIKFQLRTAPDNGGAPGTFSNWVGPGDSSSAYFDDTSNGCSKAGTTVTCNIDINSILRNGGNDQWIQYKAIFDSAGATNAGTLLDVTLEYIINTAAQITITQVSQLESGGDIGKVSAAFNISDVEAGNPDTHQMELFYDLGLTLSANITGSATSLTYSGDTYEDLIPSSGIILIDNEVISYSGKNTAGAGGTLTGLTRPALNSNTLAVSHNAGAPIYIKASSGVTFSGSNVACSGNNSGLGSVCRNVSNWSYPSLIWAPDANLSGLYKPDFKILIYANDGNSANQVGKALSAAFVFDKKAPTLGSPPIVLADQDGSSGVYLQKTNALTINVSLNASDDSALTMAVNKLCAAAQSGDFVPYIATTTTAVSAGDGNKNVPVCFKDAKGNTAEASASIILDTTPPPLPQNASIQDVSNFQTQEFKLFINWGVIADPGDFAKYNIYRSLDGENWPSQAHATIGDRLQNYYLDQGLTQNQTYYYRINSEDDIGNVPTGFAFASVSMTAGGNPRDEVAPVLNPPSVTNITTSSATITWTANENSNSVVAYQTVATGDFSGAPTQGVSTFVGAGANHSVTLIGLLAGTTYYYEIRSSDASNNTGTCQTTDCAAYNPPTNNYLSFSTLSSDTTGPQITAGPTATNITEKSAIITWVTDEPATSLVQIGLDTNYATGTFGDFNLVTSHSVTIPAILNAATQYHYRVRTTDGQGNETISSDALFTTLPSSSDTTPPTFSNIQASSITPYGATITWTTNEASDSFVEWGTTTTYGNIYGNENLVSGPPYNHSVVLPPLMNPATLVHYRVRSRDASGNQGISGDYTFTTANNPNDNTPPIISNVQIPSASITPTSAIVTWDTDEPSDSTVGFGVWPDSSYLTEQGDPTFKTSGANKHSVTLVNLTPATQYRLRVKSRDAAGNLRIDDNAGSGYTFSTPPSSVNAPVITGVTVANITYNSATVTWTTDQPSDSLVEYGFTSGYGSAQGNFTATTSHSVILTGLQSDADYHFRVRSENSSNVAAYSNDYTFRTLSAPDTAPPTITNVMVNATFDPSASTPVQITCADDTCQTQVTITWSTDELADHIVEYGSAIPPTLIATSSLPQSTDHTVILNNLTPGTVYYFQVKSRDQNNNLGTNNNSGNYFSFRTKADTAAPNFDVAPQVQVVSTTSATITWTTNEDATRQVKYSAAPDSTLANGTTYPSGILGQVLQKSHSVILTGLTPGTQYYYQAISKDAAGNTGINPSTPPYLTFTTLSSSAADTTPPNIKNVKVNGLTPPVNDTGTSVTITWDTMLNPTDTTPNDPSSSVVDYGIGPCNSPNLSLNNLAGNLNDSVTQHTVTLNNLQLDTTYCFQVRSVDSAGNMATNNNNGNYFSFTTAPDTTAPIITHNSAANVTADQRTCVIDFTTSENATVSIEYSTDANFGSLQTVSSSVAQTKHSLTLSNLTPSTKYYYRIKAADQAGNLSNLVEGTCTTKASDVVVIMGSAETEDKTPPKITNIQVVNISGSSATIKWTTDELSDSLVEFGLTTDYGETRADRTKTAFHQLTLSGLKPNTLYNFRVSSADAKGNTALSTNQTFSTSRVAGPEVFNITDVEVSSITATTAIIRWQTDALSTSQVLYGPTALYGFNTEEDKQLVLQHSVVLQNLEPATSYHFAVKSKDQNGVEKVSPDFTFLTLSSDAPTIPPVLADGPIIKDLKNNSAVVFWVTDKPSNSIVKLREVSGGIFSNIFSGEQEIGNFDEFTSSHAITLINLKPDTLYKYKVKSVDAKGNVIESGERTFRTLPIADIYAIKIEDISFTSAIVSWKTSSKTTSVVEYSLDDKFNQRVSSSDFTTDHRVKLENLTPGALYNLRVKGEDENGSVFISSSITFETLGPPQITNLKITPLKETAVEIFWNTDKETDSTIEYLNTNNGEKLTKGSPELSRNHKIILEDLTTNTNYFFQILSTDVLGRQTRSDNYSFTTGRDERPPVISQVKSENAISARGDKIQTIISWKTDEPATSQIIYKEGAQTEGKYIESPLDKELTVNHYVVLTTFRPGQIYRFKIKSSDQAGNEALSSEFTLLTPRQKESIIDLIVKNFESTFGFFKKLR